ncbi:MAG: FMN-dependent NADH-azoreductase [Allosphingosinicella sp.]
MTILHIDSSINGANSATRVLGKSIVDQLRAARPGEQVVYRDLVADPLPHLTLDAFANTTVLDEFLGADTIVVGAPMYNFTLPSQLKAWIDRLAVAGRTFRYTADGPEGLVKGKRLIVAIARGGIYREGSPAAAFEYLETYLRSLFRFVGIDPEFVVAEGLRSSEQRESSLGQALGETLRFAA